MLLIYHRKTALIYSLRLLEHVNDCGIVRYELPAGQVERQGVNWRVCNNSGQSVFAVSRLYVSF